jgi:hypothetical protein
VLALGQLFDKNFTVFVQQTTVHTNSVGRNFMLNPVSPSQRSQCLNISKQHNMSIDQATTVPI